MGLSPFEVSLGYLPPLFPKLETDIAVPSVAHHMRRCHKEDNQSSTPQGPWCGTALCQSPLENKPSKHSRTGGLALGKQHPPACLVQEVGSSVHRSISCRQVSWTTLEGFSLVAWLTLACLGPSLGYGSSTLGCFFPIIFPLVAWLYSRSSGTFPLAMEATFISTVLARFLVSFCSAILPGIDRVNYTSLLNCFLCSDQLQLRLCNSYGFIYKLCIGTLLVYLFVLFLVSALYLL